MSRRARTRVGVISLGCAKNLVDTEVMLGHMERVGCDFVENPEDADVILVNTCAFIEPAREESIRTILEAAELKKGGTVKRLVVAGCMVQRYADELAESLPEVDEFLGLDELDRITGAIGVPAGAPARPETTSAPELPLVTVSTAPTAAPSAVAAWNQATYLYDDRTPRRRATAPWTAYVKIAEGCDHTCSFCAIPTFRGQFRSRGTDSIVREARQLAAQGVREINLIAQDSSHYGRDRGREEGLPELLQALDGVDELAWIRLHYLYPNTITERLIECMAGLSRVVPYVDLPLQHAHPETLRRMRRGGSMDTHLALLERFRRAMPDVALRTTFLVGFPGESEAEFEALLEFVDTARFDHVGVFSYSHEERTTAHTLEDDVPPEIKEERRNRLMQRQQPIVMERNQTQVGRRVRVLVEGAHPETEHLLVGRMQSQAPEVDGQVLLNDGHAAPGEFATVDLTETAGYDLVGTIVGTA